jgi:uncharacterized membrane protein
MPLTYQPFATAPQLSKLQANSPMNVADGERLASVVAGSGLAVAGLSRGGWAGLLLVGLGGMFIRRGVVGRCLAYEHLGINARSSRPGVPGDRGHRVEAAVEIACPAARLFAFWRKLENLPQVMRHVKSVEVHDVRYSHWKIEGPAGRTFEWDAEIINEAEGRLIAWQSLPGAMIAHAGSVWFEPAADANTRVKVALEFDSPGGRAGIAVAGLFGISPEADLREDLGRFKEFAERHLASDIQ